MIFAFVSGEMRRVKMDYNNQVFKSVHHALQPCSVCHKLLAIDVNSQGEIQSSGTNFCFRPNILPVHAHYDPDKGKTFLHYFCCRKGTGS